MYQILDDLEKIQDSKENPSKRKSRLKWMLIILWILIALIWVRAWLTKAWFIPNWLKIDALYKLVDCNQEFFYRWESPIIDWFKCREWTYYRGGLFDYGCSCHPEDSMNCICEKKPIIYFYPTTETEINVKLWTPENLLHTYPKYNSEKWRKVIAQPNWDLEDIDSWRKLYALYREWKGSNETNFDEWFVVAWKDIIPFLEEKLAILWLNEREAEEFIVYWLPQMEGNKYNLIRFETIDEQNENMPLNITPTPDTVIRVMMDWKTIDEPIEIPQKELITPERKWFTVVEWWGSPRN